MEIIIGYTAQHLHQRIAKHKYSAISGHLLEAHRDENLLNGGKLILRSQEVPQEIGLRRLRNVIHQRTEPSDSISANSLLSL